MWYKTRYLHNLGYNRFFLFQVQVYFALNIHKLLSLFRFKQKNILKLKRYLNPALNQLGLHKISGRNDLIFKTWANSTLDNTKLKLSNPNINKKMFQCLGFVITKLFFENSI